MRGQVALGTATRFAASRRRSSRCPKLQDTIELGRIRFVDLAAGLWRAPRHARAAQWLDPGRSAEPNVGYRRHPHPNRRGRLGGVFSAVEHFDACRIGLHAAKIGNRFAALQPIAQGLQAASGTTGAQAGQGLKLRRNHGTQYTADDFLKQIEFWASTRVSPSLSNRRPTASLNAEGTGDPRPTLPQLGGGSSRRHRVQGSL